MADFKVYGSIVFLPLILSLWSSVFMVQTTNAKVIPVGGEGVGWLYGFKYAEWASKAGPFHVNDTLVFEFSPAGSNSIPHSVYLLKNTMHYDNCIIEGGLFLADSTTANKKSHRYYFKLRKAHRYYFACGVGNGTHCNLGLMKFGVTVLP